MSLFAGGFQEVAGFCRSVTVAVFFWGFQALILFGAAWLAVKLDRSRSAGVRHRIWLLSFIAVAALPLLSLANSILPLLGAASPIAWPPGGVDSAFGDQAPLPAGTAISLVSVVWVVLCAAWAAGAAASLTRLGFAFRKLNHIRSVARPVTPADLHCASFEALAGRLAQPEIRLSPDVTSPVLAGLIRPAIILPADIVSWTSPEERLSMLCHELAHIERRDPAVQLVVSVLHACHFYNPMFRFACGQLSLERELACDDQVLGRGTIPQAYAESILKAAERNLLNDAVHDAASFASRKKLERRIDMIMHANRSRKQKEWRFLLAPAAVILLVAWLVLPGASGGTGSEIGVPVPDVLEPAGSTDAGQQSGQAQPVVDKTTIWLETVKRGTMVRQVRGLGVVRPAGGRYTAELQLPAEQAKEVRSGQAASIDTRTGIIPGKVIGTEPAAADGRVAIQVSLAVNLPALRAGQQVDGMIIIEELKDVLYVGRPAHGRAGSTVELFRIDKDGHTATRVPVRLGRSSVSSVEILDGLKEGDKVILSDMSPHGAVQTVRLK
jgi:beta-lactamase regulating signal transducer with metallopeptidase domain